MAKSLFDFGDEKFEDSLKEKIQNADNINNFAKKSEKNAFFNENIDKNTKNNVNFNKNANYSQDNNLHNNNFNDANLSQNPTLNTSAEMLNKYKNMDKNQLLSQLYSEVNRQKANGTFDPKKLEQAVDKMGSYLSPQQRQNIKSMIKSLE